MNINLLQCKAIFDVLLDKTIRWVEQGSTDTVQYCFVLLPMKNLEQQKLILYRYDIRYRSICKRVEIISTAERPDEYCDFKPDQSIPLSKEDLDDYVTDDLLEEALNLRSSLSATGRLKWDGLYRTYCMRPYGDSFYELMDLDVDINTLDISWQHIEFEPMLWRGFGLNGMDGEYLNYDCLHVDDSTVVFHTFAIEFIYNTDVDEMAGTLSLKNRTIRAFNVYEVYDDKPIIGSPFKLKYIRETGEFLQTFFTLDQAKQFVKAIQIRRLRTDLAKCKPEVRDEFYKSFSPEEKDRMLEILGLSTEY